VEGGRSAGRYVLEKLGGKGGVIELEGTPGASPAIDRKKGFDEIINPSGVKILVSQAADFNRAKANSTMENLMQAHPKFDAVFGANDEMIIGAIEAISAAGIDPAKKVTVGYDATTDALDYLKQGKLGATIDQFPGKQAAMALNYLVDYIKSKKEPPQKVIYIAPQAVTSAK
jgi:ribose transport system substrate-binding protein